MSSEHPFAQYVRILGKGKTGSRSLSLHEAEIAMQMILREQVTTEQIGAFLMLLRVKEESSEEIAGFVKACRLFIAERNAEIQRPAVDIDWSSYAGKSKQPNWYVLSMILLANAGIRIFAHGARGHTVGRIYTQDIFEALNLPVAHDWETATRALARHSLCFMPLEVLCPPLFDLIQLRNQFGLRSPVHTLCRLLNPTAAKATLQSVFHPSYAETHHRAAELLNEDNAMVIKGDSGEFEYRPQAKLAVRMLSNGESQRLDIPRCAEAKLDIALNANTLREVWEDQCKSLAAEELRTASQAVIGTAALALLCQQKARNYDAAYSEAQNLWQNRDRKQLQQLAK